MKNKQVVTLLAGTVLTSSLLTGCSLSESTVGQLLDYVGSDDNSYLMYGVVQPADDSNNIQLDEETETIEENANTTIDNNTN
jgi:hypothetical protein